MVNVPVLPAVSGHLLGGVLAAVLLGPELAVFVMASVLAIQALAFGDGGLLAWGANLVNMGLLPAGLVAIAKLGRTRQGRPASTALLAGCLALAATLLAAGLLVAEVAIGRGPLNAGGLPRFAEWMFGSHLLIGLAEGGLTAAVVGAVACFSARWASFRYQGACLASLAAGLLLLCWPLGSALPDGYERAAESAGMAHLLAGELAAVEEVGWLNGQIHQWQSVWLAYSTGSWGDGPAHAVAALVLSGGLALLGIGIPQWCARPLQPALATASKRGTPRRGKSSE
jgi:ABC-type Co2+ transport system permease subunit